MNIWITGSAGFLGNRLAFAFNSAGHRVLGLSRRPSPSADTAVTIDLADRDASRKLRALTEDWGQPEAVIHSGGQPSPATHICFDNERAGATKFEIRRQYRFHSK
jgi:nucleoside-diphosphate-sugar epimerase